MSGEITVHCRNCGGQRLHVEGLLTWNFAKQAYDVESVDSMSSGHWCDDCETNVHIERREAKAVPKGPYFAHHVTAIVQTPGDSEQTTCIVVTTNDERTFEKTGCPGGLLAYVPCDETDLNAKLLAERFAATPELIAELKHLVGCMDEARDPRLPEPCPRARALLNRLGVPA